MIETIKIWDEELFLFLNSFHFDWLDPVMYAMTKTLVWVPLYAFLVYIIIKKLGQSSIWIFIGIFLAILISDQTTSGFMKPFFERPRPCHDPRWEGIMFNYKRCGGMFGFASSHASNTFALATYLWLTFKRKVPGFGWMFLWAAIVSYTRLYLGVHYPADLIVGAIVGLLAGWFSWWLVIKIKMTAIRKVEKMDE
ncbi:phosphatase PAP2 family protein [Echinicola marina]|uniref:phosphatase PAP2 family protein n=1 Tax=Echinicola marina TaxID=2859768 RepID=UPI001CF6B9F0|nr:phosphatase PAP2 family protein [Echinicola marina]UCS92811.1 phosphatase PAP2 family protein [Echinicola marina]